MLETIKDLYDEISKFPISMAKKQERYLTLKRVEQAMTEWLLKNALGHPTDYYCYDCKNTVIDCNPCQKSNHKLATRTQTTIEWIENFCKPPKEEKKSVEAIKDIVLNGHARSHERLIFMKQYELQEKIEGYQKKINSKVSSSDRQYYKQRKQELMVEFLYNESFLEKASPKKGLVGNCGCDMIVSDKLPLDVIEKKKVSDAFKEIDKVTDKMYEYYGKTEILTVSPQLIAELLRQYNELKQELKL